MLVSGVPARARRIKRRLAARWCRHKVAFPLQIELRLLSQVNRARAAGEITNLA
jgi:hypothetical protein